MIGGGVANAAGTTAIAASGGNGYSTGGGVANAAAGTPAGDTSKCPAWPASKVLPIVGPLFYGRNAGPCTSRLVDANGNVTTTTYTYASDQLQSMVRGVESTITMTWTAGSLTGEVETSATEITTHQFTYTANGISDVSTRSGDPSTSSAVYTLSSTGYPLGAVATNLGATAKIAATYVYDNCQLVQRIAMSGGLADPLNTITYEYDALGHVSARRFGDGRVETFEYSCWTN